MSPVQPSAFFASDSPPRWSPDGKRVLATLGGSLEIQTIGSQETLPVGPRDQRVTNADWNPKGDELTYSYYGRHQGQPDKHWGVLSTSANDGEERVFSSTGRRGTWSPDGSSIAYELVKREAPRRLAVMDSFGDHETILAEVPVEHLDWSPSGGQILVSSRGLVDSTLKVFDLEAKTLKDLLPISSNSETNGVFSPDGSQVAFERKDRINGRTELYIFDRESKTEKRVKTPDGRSFDPAWSVDGKSLVYTHQVPGDDYDLYQTDLERSEVTQLTNHQGNEYAPVFSPDGSQIAYYQTDPKAPRGQQQTLEILEV